MVSVKNINEFETENFEIPKLHFQPVQFEFYNRFKNFHEMEMLK